MASFDRKTAQLERAIARSLQRTLDIDIDDPVLDGVFVVEVRLADGGCFFAVFSSPTIALLDEQRAHLEGALGLFRARLATDLTRKRVPTVQVLVMPA